MISSQPPLIALGKEQTCVYCLIERSPKLRESLERREHGYENIASISIADIFRVFLEEVKKIPEKNKKRILMIVELREIMILQQK